MGNRTRKASEKSTAKKKLVLKKETIRELAPLSDDELAGAVGGYYRAPSAGDEPC